MKPQPQSLTARLSAVVALFLGVILLWTLAAPPAVAQYFGRNKVQYEVFDFRVMETPQFNIHFYPEAEEGVRDAARMAERWYTRLSTIFGHDFREKKSIILYADDTDFQQTNVLGGMIGEGLQGAVEGFRMRLVMPLTGSYEATQHVLGHEIIHQFQFDISQRAGQFNQFVRLPLWFIEGMAEYFSVGRADPHTTMWLRDAIIRDAFPTLEQLSRDPRYFPYRYGQAFWAWIGGTYGDEAAVQLFRAALTMPLDSAIVAVTGLRVDSLDAAWKRDVSEAFLPAIRGMQAPPYRGPDIAGTPAERLEELGLAPLLGRRVLARDIDGGNMNVSPAISPDGRYVAFLSERDLFGIDLFLADAQTGQVIKRLRSVGTDPHLDAIRFIDSAGTWSPDGTRFAFVTFVQGRNELALLDVASREIVQRIQITGVGAIKDPAWSPDGQTLAFTGIRGGIANLYTVDIAGGAAQVLTSDRHADLQPTWSPDGRHIAFTTDRGPETSFESLTFSPLELAVFDIDANEVEVLSIFDGAKHINPQFSPDGESIYFVSDRGGVSNVYRLHRPTGNVYQVTNVATGISGIAAHSPTLTVSAQTGTLMYSVFEAQNQNVYALEPEDAAGTLVRQGVVAHTPPPAPGAEVGVVLDEPLAADLVEGPPPDDPADDPSQVTPIRGVPAIDTTGEPPPSPDEEPDVDIAAEPPVDREGTPAALVMDPDSEDPREAILGLLPPAAAAEVSRVEQYLADAEAGLPATGDFPDRPYRPRLALDYITQPTAGVGYDPFLGFGFGGGIAARFSDMLGDNILGVTVQANGTLRDIGGQAIYLNLGRRLNWGAMAGHIPYLQVYFTDPRTGVVRILQRTLLSQVGGLAQYPFSQNRRLEASLGVRRIAYGFEFDVLDPATGRLARQRVSTEEAESIFRLEPGTLDPIYLVEGGSAFVGDYSFFGFTSPVRGSRYRFGLDATLGALNYGTGTADYRRYEFFRPFFTLAFRGMHYGRYGPDADSDRLFPLFLGHGMLVRGYSLGSFENENLTDQQARRTLNQLYGTSIGVANLELRMPLFGTAAFGLIDFPFVPTELSLFADAGMAWGELADLLGPDEPLGRPFGDQRPIFSTGISARMNVLGALILEAYYAMPFNRADERRGVFGLNFTPGW
jgi:Tol biopolymer transport system component